jgi:hypothetical protein
MTGGFRGELPGRGVGKLPASGFNLAEGPLADETMELFKQQAPVAFAGEAEGAFELGLRGGTLRCTVEVAEDGASGH